jgi:hypothetical protein
MREIAIMSRPKITLYVDIVSPFAYMAYYILKVRPLSLEKREKRRECARHKCIIESAELTVVFVELACLQASGSKLCTDSPRWLDERVWEYAAAGD